jgi:hypothetical protein
MSSPRRRAVAHVLEVVLLVATLGVGWLVWSLVAWRRGQTPAKQLLRMRCIDTWTGRAAGFRAMARREVADKWLPAAATLGLWLVGGGLLVLGERREAAWDKTAGAIVIDDPDGRYAPPRWHDRRHGRPAAAGTRPAAPAGATPGAGPTADTGATATAGAAAVGGAGRAGAGDGARAGAGRARRLRPRGRRRHGRPQPCAG